MKCSILLSVSCKKSISETVKAWNAHGPMRTRGLLTRHSIFPNNISNSALKEYSFPSWAQRTVPLLRNRSPRCLRLFPFETSSIQSFRQMRRNCKYSVLNAFECHFFDVSPNVAIKRLKPYASAHFPPFSFLRHRFLLSVNPTA